MEKQEKDTELDIATSIEKSVEGVDSLFRMKLYIYLLIGAMIYSLFLFLTRAAALGSDSIGYYLHLIFFIAIVVFYIMALITKKYAPYVTWLLSILFVLATSLYLTSEIGTNSPVYHFYTALMVVSLFLIGIKFCTTMYVLTNLMYISSWTKLPTILGLDIALNMYADDYYFYVSRIGSLAFIYSALLFIHKLKISQHDMIVHIAKIYRDNEKHSVSKQIIAGFAHEINNPLAIINASASKLEREPNSPEVIGKIKKSVYRVSGILRVLLKSVEDQATKSLEHNVDELVQKCLVDMQLSPTDNSRLKLKYHIESKIFAKVDEESLYSVISEIIKNAKEAGEASAENTTISIAFKARGDGFVFECSDDASFNENQNTENFSRLFYTTKHDKPGRGMGLYMVTSICQKLNWNFSLQRINGNTKAEVFIPGNYIKNKSAS